MTENPIKQKSSALLVSEENQLIWDEVLKKFKSNFGNDIYESWIKNINLKKVFRELNF